MPQEALAEIDGGRATQFSPVVDAFLATATSRPTEFGLGPVELALRAV